MIVMCVKGWEEMGYYIQYYIIFENKNPLL